MNDENSNGYGIDRSGLRTSVPVATWGRWSGSRLRLVASRDTGSTVSRGSMANRLHAVPAATAAFALPQGSYDIRFTSSRRPGASKQESDPGHRDKRRLHVRHQEGIIMKAFERLIRTVGHFVAGFGAGLALVCAFVIVTTDLGETPKPVRPEDIVHLDPVVVTISADRFAQIQAELHGAPVLVRTPNQGATQG